MNILEFCSQYGVSYVERGPNVARDNIAVNCPFCRMEHNPDPSYHMGISRTGDAYGCWRDPRHRGRKMWRLVAALIGCSAGEARRIAGEDRKRQPYSQDFAGQVSELLVDRTATSRFEITEALMEEWDSAFDLTDAGMLNRRRYRDYLSDRGFEDIDGIAKRHSIRFATSGRWKQRLLFPVCSKGKIAAITGRTIREDEKLRYLSSGVDEGDNIKNCLYDEDRIEEGGDALFITEGILDAIKLSCFLPTGMNTTCLFSSNATKTQCSKLIRISRKYKRAFIVFDRKSEGIAASIERRFLRGAARALGASELLPRSVSDPGDLIVRRHSGYVMGCIEKLTS